MVQSSRRNITQQPYSFILAEPLCEDKHISQVWQLRRREKTYYVEHIVTPEQLEEISSSKEGHEASGVPNENLAQCSVRLSVLELFRVCKLHGM